MRDLSTLTPRERMRTLMQCPDCEKFGVSLRFNSGGDFYGCRYCDFFAYTAGHDDVDVRNRSRLDELNPDHPLRPRGTDMKYCPYPGCGFGGTDDEVDDHRVNAHQDEPQQGSNLDNRPKD